MLQKYLINKFNISANEKLDCRIISDKIFVSQLLKVIKSRGTEENIISTIEKLNLDSKDIVISYLSGVADSLRI